MEQRLFYTRRIILLGHIQGVLVLRRLCLLEEHMPESQSKFVHWQNLEYEAWYEVTGRKTEIVPGSFHPRPNSQHEKENNMVGEAHSEVVDSTYSSR